MKKGSVGAGRDRWLEEALVLGAVALASILEGLDVVLGWLLRRK